MRRLLPLALFLLTPALSAQILSIYGTYSPVHLAGVDTGATCNLAGACVSNTASYWSNGVGGGVTLNFLHLGLIRLGLDARGSTRPGTPGADTALFGLRLAVKPPLLPIRPYIQASAGYVAARTSAASGLSGVSSINKYAAYEIIGGVDYKLLPFLDLRLIEVGAGAAILNSPYNPTLFTVNTGVVLHF